MRKLKEKLSKILNNSISPVIIVAIALILFSFFLGYNNKEKKQTYTETEETEITYIELYFGNGEVYKQEATVHRSVYWAYPYAQLENGYAYSFEEAYQTYYDTDSGTYKLYLWRDEPYQLEKENFKKIK